MLTNAKSNSRPEASASFSLGIIPVGGLSSFGTRRRISNCDSGISVLLEYLRCYIANRGFLVLIESDNSGTPGIGEALGTSG